MTLNRLLTTGLIAVFALTTELSTRSTAQDQTGGFGGRIAGTYLVEGRITAGGPTPDATFLGLLVLGTDGAVAADTAFASPQPPGSTVNSASFGTWKRTNPASARLRFFTFNRMQTPAPELLATDEVVVDAYFDAAFGRFEGPFTVTVFCSNKALCGAVQDPLSGDNPLFVVTGTITGRRIRAD